MEEQLINNNLNKCFFSKQMTYLESRDFVKNEQHITQCLDCRQKLLEYELKKQELVNDFDSYQANTEVKEILLRELDELIPDLEEAQIKGSPVIRKRQYNLALRDFVVFITFGISRKLQLIIVATLILAACIY
ncbi:hypothetical protein M902_2186 [Bacteriovorax sp. BAL6_X]|uniref:hypothetical protein n=1 Tax=Bacteriovorax sp. BAL6_X TaxID=1201290 RepID=UPI000386D763|nr:hypothetical protein [Bacteriovorax sp. BAL6_X]EPZ51687.1 hypothetical protein M902_2186 [Bacteriovorax sp. BAL6_X]